MQTRDRDGVRSLESQNCRTFPTHRNDRGARDLAFVMLVATSLALPAPASAQDLIYGIVFRSTDNFIAIDPSTGGATVLGDTDARHGLSTEGERLYGLATREKLVEIDPADGTTISEAEPPFGIGSEGAVAIRSDGVGFAIRGRTSDPVELWRFDLGGGSATLVDGDLGRRYDGLAFDPSDVLFGFSQRGNLYTIDTSTGAQTLVGDPGIPSGSTAGMTFTSDGTLYIVEKSALYEVDPTSAASTLVGPTGIDGQLSGLASIPARELRFSLDIGSDMEISDPGSRAADEQLDPGDVYASSSVRSSLSGPPYLDDEDIFGRDPHPIQFKRPTAVPVGSRRASFDDYFDLDGYEALDVSLSELGIDGGILAAPVLFDERVHGDIACIHASENMLLSFDDDNDRKTWRLGISRIPTDSGPSLGTAMDRSEVVALRVSMGGYVPAMDEPTVHVDLGPGPDAGEEEDDDVDALDFSVGPECAVEYFAVDGEGTNRLSSSSIYEVTSTGPVERIDHRMIGTHHPTITARMDIDAFELAWVPLPEHEAYAGYRGRLALGLIFSVSNDKRETKTVDESGGLDRRIGYVSFLDGRVHELLGTVYQLQNIDALTIVPAGFELPGLLSE